MSSGRCWGCCQENCGYRNCGCACHGDSEVRVLPEGGRRIEDTMVPCKDCGLMGLHFCTGKQKRAEDSILEQIDRELLKMLDVPKCKAHPRYEAKRRPRTPCEPCWRKYIKLHP